MAWLAKQSALKALRPNAEATSLGSFQQPEFQGALDLEHGPQAAKKSVLRQGQSQALEELLHFFAKTHHSTIPIVEDTKGSLVYNLSRRDLLSYLDLAMQSARPFFFFSK